MEEIMRNFFSRLLCAVLVFCAALLVISCQTVKPGESAAVPVSEPADPVSLQAPEPPEPVYTQDIEIGDAVYPVKINSIGKNSTNDLTITIESERDDLSQNPPGISISGNGEYFDGKFDREEDGKITYSFDTEIIPEMVFVYSPERMRICPVTRLSFWELIWKPRLSILPKFLPPPLTSLPVPMKASIYMNYTPKRLVLK
jgi:hypothetical protein